MRRGIALTFGGLLAFAAAVPGCGPTGEGERVVFVVDELIMLIEPEPATDADVAGVIEGFDIDGFDGRAPGDDNVCRAQDQTDFMTPTGERGVDNGFAGGGLAGLVGLLAEQDGDSAEIFEGLLQGGVTGGTLLVLLEIEGIHSFENDSDVTLTVHLGQPFDVGVGTDGRLLSGQSFDIREGTEPVRVNARIRDRILYAEGVDMLLSGSILDVEFDVPVELGQIALEFNENGTVTGTLGGGVPWQTIADVIPRIGGAGQFATIGARILSGLADIMDFETGECRLISAGIRVHGVPAFIFDDAGI